MIYLALLIIAIWVNRANQGSLLLTLVIGASAFAYIPLELVTDRNTWFVIVVFADLFIAYIAFAISVPVSVPLVGLSLMLCTGHVIDWSIGTDPTYYVIANYLEYLEIISCVVFSPIVLSFIRQKVRHAIRNT